MTGQVDFDRMIANVPPDRHVLIAGATASGKSSLALEIAARQGGVIVNADASQVYTCWRVITARPSPAEEARAPHALYGHVAATETYSTGHWLREMSALLAGQARLIVVGGTGLYFKALTEGLAPVPATPPEVRRAGDALPLEALLDAVDGATRAGLDTANRARVQRAWEVLQATGRGLAEWQAKAAPAPLPLADCHAVRIDADKDWLNARIEQRFDAMIEGGALAEVAAMRDCYEPTLPAHRAIGVPELMSYINGDISLSAARDRAGIATRQYAKRQRTWMRSKMTDWHVVMRP
ncbi:MAG: tRNA (adenosine(37)-N6)-dimethylallyltransferase MiaA [Pseudomonadota bacterium]